MKNKRVLLILNLLIIIFEIIGFAYCYVEIGSKLLIYYTEISNLLLFITSLFYVSYIFSKKKLDRWFNILKEVSVISVLITFLVVIFILIPYQNFDFNGLLFKGSMLYHHLICPLLGMIMFIFFDKESINKRDYLYANALTVIYAIVFIILNLFKVLEGPYFFLYVYKNPIYMSLIWIAVIPFGTFLLSKLMFCSKNKVLTKK